MKRYLLILLTFLLVVSFAACGTNNTGTNPDGDTNNSVNEGSLEEILAEIYDTAELSDQFREYIETGLQTTQITPDNITYHFGTADLEYEVAIASEPIMSPSAYELCLIRVKDGADIEKIKTAIKENVDPMKWVCVGVDPDNIYVDNIENLVVLIMSDDAGKELHEAFLKLNK